VVEEEEIENRAASLQRRGPGGSPGGIRCISDGRRVIFLNVADIARLGLQKDQWVDITSYFQDETRRAERFKVVPYEIPVGCAATYYPETDVLVSIRDTADGSNQPASKSIVISLAPTLTPTADVRPESRALQAAESAGD
jgi:hypothetical protein